MKKMFLTIALLVSCSMTSNLYSQSFNSKYKAYKDTLSFEYEGPLQMHEKIIIRAINYIQKTYPYPYVNYEQCALVISYKKRISSLSENYFNRNAEVRIVKAKAKIRGFGDYEYKEYKLVNGLNIINSRVYNLGELFADNYLDVILSYCNVLRANGSLSFSEIRERVLDNIENNNFANLLSQAERNGIKKTATKNGFYNKKLAKQLAEVILINKIENLYKSNKALAYRIAYIGDANIALHKLRYKSEQEEMLEIMINKY